MKQVFLVVLLLCPVLLKAQGFQVNMHGQKQIAMGGTGTGLNLDAANVFYNPGAISMLEKNSIQGGVSPLFLKSTFLGDNNVQYNNESKVATPFQFYAVWGPKDAKWKAAVGAYTPFGGLMYWGDNWKGKYAVQSLKLQIIYIQPTFSYKLTDKLGVGVGFVYGIGDVELKKAIPLNDGSGLDGQAKLKGSGHGFGFNAGVYYKASDKLSIGVSYRSKVSAEVKDGDAIFTVPASLQSSFPSPNKFYNKLPLPSTTSVGFGYKATDKLLLALDFNYVHWSVYDTLAFDYSQKIAPGNTHDPRNYKDSYNIRLGAQYQVTDAFAVRAGVNYGKTPVKDGYVTPEVPDADRIELSAGLGYKLSEHFELDASFLFVDMKKRTQTNLETNLSGTIKTYVYLPGFSVNYKF